MEQIPSGHVLNYIGDVFFEGKTQALWSLVLGLGRLTDSLLRLGMSRAISAVTLV